MKLGTRSVGPGHPPFVIAELSANHMQQYDLAAQLVKEAAAAGADAVKFQVFRPDDVTMNVDRPTYRLASGPWEGIHLYELYRDAMMPWEWLPDLFAIAADEHLIPLATVHHQDAIDYLETLDCPGYKVASPEFYDLELIRDVAQTGKPLIISYGAAQAGHAQTLGAIVDHGAADRLIRLFCVSEYPTPLHRLDLPRMRKLFADTFNGQVMGFSDHTVGIIAPALAIALGAHVIEKHLALPDTTPLDAAFSLAPKAFAEMVATIHATAAACSSPPTLNTVQGYLRRLVYAEDLPDGTVLTSDHLRTARCGEGCLPPWKRELVGRVLCRPVEAGQGVDPLDIA